MNKIQLKESNKQKLFDALKNTSFVTNSNELTTDIPLNKLKRKGLLKEDTHEDPGSLMDGAILNKITTALRLAHDFLTDKGISVNDASDYLIDRCNSFLQAYQEYE